MKSLLIAILLTVSLIAQDRFIEVYGYSSSSYTPNYITIKTNIKIEANSFVEAKDRFDEIIDEEIIVALNRNEKTKKLTREDINFHIQKGIRKKSYVRKVFYFDCLVDFKIKNTINYEDIYEKLVNIDELKIVEVVSGRYDDENLRNEELKRAFLNAKQKATLLRKLSANDTQSEKVINIIEIIDKEKKLDEKRDIFIDNKVNYKIKLLVKFIIK